MFDRRLPHPPPANYRNRWGEDCGRGASSKLQSWLQTSFGTLGEQHLRRKTAAARAFVGEPERSVPKKMKSSAAAQVTIPHSASGNGRGTRKKTIHHARRKS